MVDHVVEHNHSFPQGYALQKQAVSICSDADLSFAASVAAKVCIDIVSALLVLDLPIFTLRAQLPRPVRQQPDLATDLLQFTVVRLHNQVPQGTAL